MLSRFFSRNLSWLIVLFIGLSLAGIAGWLVYQSGDSQTEVETEQERDVKPMADAWFVEQRAYPLNEIPPGAYVKASDELTREERRMRRMRAQLYGDAAEAMQMADPKWEAIGPAPISNGQVVGSRPVSGRVSAIALDPNYNGTTNQTVYVGAAQGGVWKSTDNGATWTPITDDQASLATGSIVIDPTNSNVIYVGTGEGNQSADSYYGAGILKSTDGGATWTQIKGPNSPTSPNLPVFINCSIPRIAIDPTNTSTLYVCTRTAGTNGATGGSGAAPLGQRGIWKSTDGGSSWKNLDPQNNGGTINANDLVLDPKNNSRVFAAMQADGIYRSTMSGEPGTWQKMTSGLPTTDTRRYTLAVGPPLAPSTNSTFYAAISNTGGTTLLGIYRTTDNGDTWTKLNNQPAASQTFYNLDLVVDPTDANTIYFGEVNFHRSTDGGNTWVSQTNGVGTGGIHVDQHAFVISPTNRSLVFNGNDGGIWRSDSATATNIPWTNLNATLNTVQFQSLALHPLDANFIIGGTQDNGTNRFTGDIAWTRIAGGDGGTCLIDQSNPLTVYHSFQNSTATGSVSYGPRVSFDGGNTWSDRGCRNCTAQPGRLNPTDRVQFYSPLAQHVGFTEAPGNVIYWGTQRVYRSANNGATWTGLGASSDGYGSDLSKGSGRVSAIATFPKLDTSTNPPKEIVWVGTTDGNVQVTTSAGDLATATFTNVVKAPLPNRFVTDIAPDLNDPQKAYVVYSGFNLSTPTTPGHVFVTSNQGATWTDISGNLPDVPVTSIAIDPHLTNTLYIGTDLGVFRTSNNGATWERLGNGMPRVATFMVRYQVATRTLVAATHGRGMYRLRFANPVATVSAADYSRTLAAEGIVAAFGTGMATAIEAAASQPLPTSLAGTTVKVRDVNGVERSAPLFFVSPAQVNYLIPAGTAPGAVAVTITSSDGTISTGSEQVRSVGPTLFTANASGSGVPAAYGVRVRNNEQTLVTVSLRDNATNQFVPAEIDLGPDGDVVALVLFGTGIRKRSALTATRVTIGGVQVQPDYAGEAPGFTGLDQLNVIIPRSLIGRGEIDLVVRADNVDTNTVRIRIK